MVVAAVCVGIGVALCVLVLFSWIQKLVERMDGIPGPVPLPLLGSFHLIRCNPTSIHQLMVKMVKKYGPLIRFVMGVESYVLVADADSMQAVLGNPGYKSFDRAPKEQYVSDSSAGAAGATPRDAP